MKQKPYRVSMHRFIGHSKSEYGESYTYEISFNRSLVHTGRFKGIEDGLNEYERKEKKQNVLDAFKNAWYSFVAWIK